MLSDNIIIIGFMGTGKTTVGRILTDKLNWTFVDTDHQVSELTGMSIPAIFEKHGETWFRNQETAVIEQVLSSSQQVVSTGGGAVLRKRNREVMLKSGLVVALTADVDTIVARVSINKERPLLQGDVRKKVETLMAERRNAYSFAHLKLDTTNLTPNQLADQIIHVLHTRNPSS